MKNTEIPIIPIIYDLILWFTKKVDNFPKKYKYTFGERITNILLNILRDVIEARFSKNKENFLRNANINTEELRFIVRLSKDTQSLSLQDYEYAIKQVDEIGKMIGGWEKYTKRKNIVE